MTSLTPEVAALLVRVGDLTGTGFRPTALTDELSRAAASVRQLFDAAGCSVALVDRDGGSMTFAAAAGAGADAIVGLSLPLDRGIAGWVAMTAQGIAIGDVTKDARFAADVAAMTQYVPDTIFAAPLVTDRDGVVGVIEVLDPQFAAEDTAQALNVLGTVGDQVASIVLLARVYDGVGKALLSAAAGAQDVNEFGAALAQLASSGEDEMAALAETFHDLARSGPAAATLARRILHEVVEYARATT